MPQGKETEMGPAGISRNHGRWVKMFALSIAMLAVTDSMAGEDSLSPDRLRGMSLEELMQVTVVSASRREQKIEDTAGAVHVITRQDLASTKVRTVAEALRLVPGLQVAQIDANRWAIGSRGFNSRYANKLLVLIDGRSVYSELFSGVHWGIEDLPLEIIDRIEVIRGPGASMWGSNAVNGVINIITRPASDMVGLGASVGGGVEENAFGEAWYGTSLSDDVSLRVAAKSFARDAYRSLTSEPANDGWSLHRANVRLDWARSKKTDISFFADAHGFMADQTVAFSLQAPPWQSARNSTFESRGGSVVGRWTHRASEERTWSAQSYAAWTDRDVAVLDEKRLTWDTELNFDTQLGDRSQLMLGGSYRLTDEKIEGPDPAYDFGSPAQTNVLWGMFAQLQFSLVPERLEFTLGSKLEDHPYTEPELQPTARLLWNAANQHTFWAAGSRAVRSPSRAEVDGRYDFGALIEPGRPILLIYADGNPDLRSEELIAWELGYRFVPKKHFSLDVAAFVNQYEQLRGAEVVSTEIFSSPSPGYMIVNTKIVNELGATAWGGELSAKWQAASWLRFSGFYSFFDIDFKNERLGGDRFTSRYYRHGAFLRSEMELAPDWSLDTSFHVHSPLIGGEPDNVERLDMALSWQIQSDVEFSVVGQSLLHSHQTEFENFGFELGSQVERAVFAMVRWGR